MILYVCSARRPTVHDIPFDRSGRLRKQRPPLERFLVRNIEEMIFITRDIDPEKYNIILNCIYVMCTLYTERRHSRGTLLLLLLL